MRASTPSRSSWRTGSAAAGPAVPVGAGQPVLRAQHLSKSYHSPVLRDLDLDVEQGQFVAIMGPSGSGKSTLLHCLSGMDQPDAGSVLLGGQEITEDVPDGVKVFSPDAPLGQALMGHRAGDTVSYEAPNGRKIQAEIVKVERV